MSPRAETRHIAVPRGRSREAASFYAQLDDQSRLMLRDLRGITAAELQWQPQRGMNTIGMLLAHIAIVEVFWVNIALERSPEAGIRRVLGIDRDDDGMPLPAGAAPPAGLRSRTLGWYEQRLARARKWAGRSVRRWPDASMEHFVLRTRRDGKRMRVGRRWILYHLLEHQAGHYGQILLLRHWYRDRKSKSA
jgi:uncharacterized damage-inducible protein DinB